MNAGRKIKLTKNKITKICRIIEDGNHVKTACQIIGISEPTFYDYIKRGEQAEKQGKKDDIFFKFLKSTEHARAIAEQKHVENITAHSIDDPKLSQWWLERSFPDRWGRTERIEHSSDKDSPLMIEFVVKDNKKNK